MTYFTREREDCKKMTFEEFINKVKDIVREKNYMNRIDDWDKNIIHSDFDDKSSICKASGSTYGDVYFGTIYFADTIFTGKLEDELIITLYTFSYYGLYTFSYYGAEYSASLDYTECSLYKREIDSICKLSSCFNVNKNGFLDCALDEYHRSGEGLSGTTPEVK